MLSPAVYFTIISCRTPYVYPSALQFHRCPYSAFLAPAALKQQVKAKIKLAIKLPAAKLFH